MFWAHHNHSGVKGKTGNWNTQNPREKIVKDIKRATHKQYSANKKLDCSWWIVGRRKPHQIWASPLAPSALEPSGSVAVTPKTVMQAAAPLQRDGWFMALASNKTPSK